MPATMPSSLASIGLEAVVAVTLTATGFARKQAHHRCGWMNARRRSKAAEGLEAME